MNISDFKFVELLKPVQVYDFFMKLQRGINIDILYLFIILSNIRISNENTVC